MYNALVTTRIVQVAGAVLLMLTVVPIIGPFLFPQAHAASHHDHHEDTHHDDEPYQKTTAPKHTEKSNAIESPHESHHHAHADHTEEEEDELPEWKYQRPHWTQVQMFLRTCFTIKSPSTAKTILV